MDDGTARIELPRKSGPSLWAVVDLTDLEQIRAHSWLALITPGRTYAQAWTRDEDGRRRNILLHRFIMNAPGGMYVDHINHDGLDNRHANLRLATNAQNQANMRSVTKGTSTYKGVHWEKSTGRWRAIIAPQRRKISLGRYSTEEEAARAYDTAALAAWGEYACLNFPTP